MKDNTQEKTVSFFGKTIPESESCFSEGWAERDAELKSKNMQERYENEGGKKLTNYAIFTAYREAEKFNKVADNLVNVTPDSISNQLSYIFSELTETIDGLEDADSVEVLDGCCDLFVTVAGLMQKLEAASFDVATALKRVNVNNMSKYIPANEAIHYDPSFTKTLNEEYQVFVLRDENMKVRKPSNFKSVDLSDLVPEDFFEGGVV